MKMIKTSLKPHPLSKKYLLTWLIVLVSILSQAQTPVERYGQLRVQGNRIVDKNGSPVQLRGMSLYWSQWIGKFYNKDCVKWLRDDWCVNVVRAAMAVDVGGYATSPAAATTEKNKIYAVIDAAIANGIYVIVDFHVHKANTYQSQAQTFFNEVSLKYKDVPNVLYEIWNEPEQVSWSGVIKPYHQNIVSVIRKNDPDNIIICGTALWSQKVDEAANDPVPGTNIAYTLHFYAASHKQWLRDLAQGAMNKGIALFVTEYGTCEATGNGPIDEAETKRWWEFLDKNYIGNCNWSVADISETSAALKPNAGVNANGGWTTNQIKPSGILVRNYLKSKCTMVNDLEQEEVLRNVVCFPNPFSEEFTLQSNTSLNYVVYDATGTKIDGNSTDGNLTIGKSWPSGIYFVKVNIGGATKTIKMSKR